MYSIHIETSTRECSVALSQGREMISFRHQLPDKGHTAALVPAIEGLLAEASLDPGQLSAVVVSSGPGSYTGLRVGSSTAKALAYALDVPLIAVPTLKALARAVFEKHPGADFALPMIDARRREVYTALYSREKGELSPVGSAILDDAFFTGILPEKGQTIACGDGSLKIGDLQDGVSRFRVDDEIRCHARYLVGPGMDLFEKGESEDPMRFVPFYLKPPNITKPKTKVL